MDAGSEHVALDASKHMLGINGIKPDNGPSIITNITQVAGYVVDLGPLGPETSGPIVDVTPE